jgi:hypothetical protein
MPEENKIRDAADAIRGIAQAVPVYQDVVQPAAREIGTGLQTVAKTIHIALAPVSALVWGYETIRDFVSTCIAEKLKNVPLGNIKTPAPHVVVPALEALRYTGHQEVLRDLYANLLATSLDTETCQNAHPAFVEMIKNMSPDEARIMRLFSMADSALPIIEIRAHDKEEAKGYRVIHRCFSLIGREAGCTLPNLTAVYLDNLVRLGLLETRKSIGAGGPVLAGSDIYEPLEDEAVRAFSEPRNLLEEHGGRLEFLRGFVGLTDLGQQFCRACVIEKEAPPA